MASTAAVPNEKRIVLITGCSAGGIGYATAQELNRTGRYRVFASARSPRKMEGLAEGISRLSLDVTSGESVQTAVQQVFREAGRIDLLINNAGVNAAASPTAEVDLDKFKATYDVNLFGVIRVTQAVVGGMVDYARLHPDKPGVIVNIGSTVGAQPLPWSAAYNSSKAALHSFSDTLRMELAPLGIRVQVVAPGKIQSQIGVNGESYISSGEGSRFSHVWDLVQERAQFSQSPHPAPMPSEDFARALRSHIEAHGALGRPQGWAKLVYKIKSWLTLNTGAYTFIGPLSKMVWLLTYFPWSWRDAIISRRMQLGRIAQGAQSKKDA